MLIQNVNNSLQLNYNQILYKCFNMLVNIQINKAWQKIIKTMI